MHTLLNLNSADDILQDLVQGVPDVQIAIGIRRSIMKYKGFLGSALAALPFIEVIGTLL